MKKLITSLLFLAISLPAYSQQKLNLPEFSIQQQLNRAVANTVSYMMFGISFAKANGKSVKEFAEHCAKITIPFYERFRGMGPAPIVESVYRVSLYDPNYKMEIIEETDSHIKGEMRLFGLDVINATQNFGGVTAEDCYEFYAQFMKYFANGLDLNYSQAIENDMIHFTISKK